MERHPERTALRAPAAAALLVLGLAAHGGTSPRQEPAQAEEGLVVPEVAIRTADFVEARAAFKTRLLREGPAPGHATLPDPPQGVRPVEFPSGALRLAAWLHVPPGDEHEKHPAVLFLHGGFAFGVEDWDMTAPYRDAGFVVLAPMLRGENGQAGTFTMFYDEVDDVLAAGRYLAEQPFVDARRVFVAGHSVGGTLALLAAMSSKEFRAAASFSASPDQVIYCRLGIDPAQIPFDAGDPTELELRSPLAYARSFRCPVRMFYGTKEPHFHLSTQRTAELARAAQLDVQAQRIEGGHESEVPAAMEASIAFFEAH